MTAEVKLSCPLITTTAQVAVAEDLPVASVDFLLGNDLAGGRVWVPTPTGGEAPEESGHGVSDPVIVVTRSQTEKVTQAVAPGADCDRAGLPEKEDSVEEEAAALGADCKEAGSPVMEGSGEEEVVGVVTRSQARRVAQDATLGADCDTAGPPPTGSSVAQLDELVPGSPVSQGVGADCRSAEPHVEAPDSAGVVAEGEERVLRVVESCAGIPHPAGHLGGSTHAVVFPGWKAVGPGTQSGPQSGMSDSLLGITTEGGDTSNCAGELEAPTPAECTGGREQAVPLPGNCLTGEAHLAGPPSSADVVVADEPMSRLRHRDKTRVSAPPLPTAPVIPPDLTWIEPALLIKGQKGDTDLAPCFAKLGKENRDIGEGEEFLLQREVLHRRSRESDGSEVLQVIVPRELREALVLLAHKGPMAGHLGV